jgi:hypothetical protein
VYVIAPAPKSAYSISPKPEELPNHWLLELSIKVSSSGSRDINSP